MIYTASGQPPDPSAFVGLLAGKGPAAKEKATRRAPWWMTAGEYQLAPYWREEALRWLEVPAENVQVDLFARPGNNARPLYVTKAMDAFTYEWSRLVEGPGRVLWANPPFALLGKVVSKVCMDPCCVALCCPEAPEARWWEILKEISVSQVVLPEGHSLYYGGIKKDILPPPEWRTVIFLVDTRVKKAPEPLPRHAKWLAERNQGKGLRELWEVYYGAPGGGRPNSAQRAQGARSNSTYPRAGTAGRGGEYPQGPGTPRKKGRTGGAAGTEPRKSQRNPEAGRGTFIWPRGTGCGTRRRTAGRV